MNYSVQQFLLAFGLALFAGLSTGFGGLFLLKADKTNTKFLSAALGFSAGVMIYVSFVYIYKEGTKNIMTVYEAAKENLIAIVAFFIGIVLIALIDKLIPEKKNPHEMQDLTMIDNLTAENKLGFDTQKSY